MQPPRPQQEKLPFRCRVLCLSLLGATLLLLLDYYLYAAGYLSMLVAIWLATAVFVLAALYESFLLSLVVKHMFKSLRGNDKPPEARHT
jgi:hypothetical protein